MVAACTDVTYGRYCAMRDQLSPSFLLAHRSPFAVPKYSPIGSRRSLCMPSRTDSIGAPSGRPLSSRSQVLPLSVVRYTPMPKGVAVRLIPAEGITYSGLVSRGGIAAAQPE